MDIANCRLKNQLGHFRDRKRRLIGGSLVACLVVGLAASGVALAQQSTAVNVTTGHNDIGRTGQNLNETILTTSNVNPTQFGKLFSQPVDGQISAQPLYLSGITINGAVHNVVFVATENDSVYAFDADNNGAANSTPLWQASLLSAAHGAAPNATPLTYTEVGTNDIAPILGITGTPVIDPNTGTLYVVSVSLENGTALHRLHALSVYTGAEKFGGPVVVSGTVPGTGSGSVNGSLTFDSLWQNQRAGLLLLNGIVYVAFASNADNGPWHGWIMGYNAATLQQTGVFCGSPNGLGSGIWMSGDGLPADQLDPVHHPFGRIIVPTGNGNADPSIPYNNTMDFGESILDLDLTNGVPTVTDEFTTYQWAALNAEDLDVGSGGLVILPAQTAGSYPHLAVQAGKTGNVYLVNRDNLGGYSTTADNVVQELPAAVGGAGAWSSPAYWNETVYYWGRNDHLKAFPLVNGLLSATPTQSTEQIGYPGASPSISASGPTTGGIVWTVRTDDNGSGPATLEARDATNIVTPLYSSATNAARDAAGIAVKMVVPTIANGKAYVGAQNEVDIYGLLANSTQTPAPTFSPGSQAFTGTLNVALMDANSNASIYYTTNGTSANTSSTLYTGTAIPITSDTTVNAIATVTGQVLSTQSTASYTATTQTQPVVFNLPGGTYSSLEVVSLSDPTSNAVIYYTLDGSTPITSATTQTYSTPITINATETITAIAVAPGYSASPVVVETYTIQEGVTGINFPLGFASTSGLGPLILTTVVPNGNTDLDDTRLQLTNGLPNEAGSAWYYAPVDVQSFTTTFSFQLSNPAGTGITFALQNSAAGNNALGGSGQNLGYAPIANSLAIKFDLANDATGLYLNGVVPLTPAVSLSGTPINLYSGDAMSVTLVYNRPALNMTITDLVTTQSWSTSWSINIPGAIGSRTAYAGFTGSTSTSTASQKILSWTYVNNYPVPFGNLEQAKDATTGSTTISPADNLWVSGWMADPTDGAPLSKITVYVDGVSVGAATLGQPRPDVATNNNNPAYLNSGFYFVYPASQLTGGPHAVTIVGVDSHQVSTQLGPLTITVAAPFGSLTQAVDSTTSSTSIPTTDNFLVTGWIADPVDGSPLGNVKVLIDGVAVGTPTLDIATPSIATQYNNSAYANAGFSFTYAAKLLTAGTHSVTVIGIDSHGASGTLGPLSITITVPPPIGHLDQSKDATTGSTTVAATDNLFVSGWIADPTDGSPMSNVTVLIDGAAVGTPTLGVARPDVVSALNNPAYLDSGFNFVYAASLLKAGAHSVTVVGVDSHGASVTLGPRSFTIPYPPPVGNLEQAVDESTGSTTVAAKDNLFVSGWIADPTDGSPMSTVTVLIDGAAVGTPTLGVARPDVAAGQNNPAYLDSGFNFVYAASLLKAGTHSVTVVGVDSHGLSVTLGPRSFTIPYSPPVGNLEQAKDATTGSTTVAATDNLFVSGWIADPTDGSPMSNVKVLIDGVVVGTAILGSARPDVAAGQNNPAYLDSGFTFVYAASLLKAGTHSVTVIGVDSHGLSVTLGPLGITVTAAP